LSQRTIDSKEIDSIGSVAYHYLKSRCRRAPPKLPEADRGCGGSTEPGAAGAQDPIAYWRGGLPEGSEEEEDRCR
jgi:hypothetical protein